NAGSNNLTLATSTTNTINSMFILTRATIRDYRAPAIQTCAPPICGTIGGTGTATIAHGATVAVTSTFQMFLARPLTNDGTIDVSNGSQAGLLFSAATLTNNADGVIDLHGKSTRLNCGHRANSPAVFGMGNNTTPT